MSVVPSTQMSSAWVAEEYLKLLLAFRALPETKSSRTFMEVSGYPHYENVCSNILQFYLDPAAEHGLKDLLLSAFLHMAGKGDVAIPERVSVDREYPAEDQKRIDLVIDCETFTLGIENKIFHWEANDFENYGRVIDQLGRNKKTIKILLCLKKAENQAMLKGGFNRYTYGELWQTVRGMLGNYISHGNPKWVTCLLDFMETTINLAGNNMETKKSDQFFIEHNEVIERLVAERDAFLARLRQKVESVKAMLTKEEVPEVSNLSGVPWIWDKRCLVLDFKFKDAYAISFDLYLTAKGWELQLFGRNAKASAYLAKLVKQPALKAKVANAPIADNRHIVQTWNIEADLGEIREALRSWLRALIEADAAEPA